MRMSSLVAVLALTLVPVVGFAADAENALVDAVKKGDRAAVRTLAKSSTVNVAEADGTTALHYAVQANDAATVDLLIRSGAKVKITNRYGVSPLTLAVTNANPDIVERLLRAGADANGSIQDGETVLMTAARVGNAAVVRLLLANGANANYTERWLGQTALMWAAAEDHAAVVEALVEAGADKNASSMVLEHYALSPQEGGTPKVATPKGGMAVLHYAARQGSLAAVRTLVEKGADIDQTDPDGLTPLIYAIINGHYDSASYLLEHGANPNLADSYGRTALFAALDMNKPEWNPRPAPRTGDKTTPLDLVKLALAKGANPNTPLTGKPPNQCGQGCGQAAVEGGTPLWRAARSADVDGVRMLLAAGADPFAPTREGQTPLMVAAGQGWRDGRSAGAEDDALETMQLLLATGVDINEKNTRNETALHGAATRGADKITKYLVEHGARLDVKDRAGRTPLDVASGVPAEEPSQANNYKTGELRESTAKLLKELMVAANIPVEPYQRPADAPKVEPAQ